MTECDDQEALFEVGYGGGHYLRGPGPMGRPEDRVGDFDGDVADLRTLFPFPVTPRVFESAYGVSYNAVAEVIQVLASPGWTAAANLVQIGTLAVLFVGYVKQKLGHDQFFVSKRIAEGLCVADAVNRLGSDDLEIIASLDIPAGRGLLPFDLGIRNLETRTYLVVVATRGSERKFATYTIRSDRKVLSIHEVDAVTNYCGWYEQGKELEGDPGTSFLPRRENGPKGGGRRKKRKTPK